MGSEMCIRDRSLSFILTFFFVCFPCGSLSPSSPCSYSSCFSSCSSSSPSTLSTLNDSALNLGWRDSRRNYNFHNETSNPFIKGKKILTTAKPPNAKEAKTQRLQRGLRINDDSNAETLTALCEINKSDDDRPPYPYLIPSCLE